MIAVSENPIDRCALQVLCSWFTITELIRYHEQVAHVLWYDHRTYTTPWAGGTRVVVRSENIYDTMSRWHTCCGTIREHIRHHEQVAHVSWYDQRTYTTPWAGGTRVVVRSQNLYDTMSRWHTCCGTITELIRHHEQVAHVLWYHEQVAHVLWYHEQVAHMLWYVTNY